MGLYKARCQCRNRTTIPFQEKIATGRFTPAAQRSEHSCSLCVLSTVKMGGDFFAEEVSGKMRHELSHSEALP